MAGIFNGIQSIIFNIKSIYEGIMLCINFLWNLIKSMFELLRLIATILATLTETIATLPAWLIAFCTASIGIAVLYVLIGRQAGK